MVPLHLVDIHSNILLVPTFDFSYLSIHFSYIFISVIISSILSVIIFFWCSYFSSILLQAKIPISSGITYSNCWHQFSVFYIAGSFFFFFFFFFLVTGTRLQEIIKCVLTRGDITHHIFLYNRKLIHSKKKKKKKKLYRLIDYWMGYQLVAIFIFNKIRFLLNRKLWCRQSPFLVPIKYCLFFLRY